MANGSTHISSSEPRPPGDADFALYIDFKKGEGNPARVFQAADAMIRAFQRLDHALCSSIDSKIEPLLVLEEIEAGSLKIWLRDILRSADDDALKKLDWKPLVGKYLVRAKYVYIEWSNKAGTAGSLLELAKQLRTIAAETDVKHLPDYTPPSIKELADVARDIDEAKAILAPGDRLLYLPAPSDGGEEKPAEFDLTVRWAPEDLMALAVKEAIEFPRMPMNLIVKRPDYLGTSRWDFRHGKVAIAAKILDDDWLRRFQNREIDVRPGDALACEVTVTRNYGYDHELIEETYLVTKVANVLQNEFRSQSGFDWTAS